MDVEILKAMRLDLDKGEPLQVSQLEVVRGKLSKAKLTSEPA